VPVNFTPRKPKPAVINALPGTSPTFTGFGAALQDLLRRKSLVHVLPLSQAALKKSGVVTTVADFASATLPLLQFGWDAVDSQSHYP